MQTLGRVLLSQLRPQALAGSSHGVTAAAAVAAGGWLSGSRFFSSEGVQRLYIGNISFETKPSDIEQAFQKFGTVHVSVQLQHASLSTWAVLLLADQQQPAACLKTGLSLNQQLCWQHCQHQQQLPFSGVVATSVY